MKAAALTIRFATPDDAEAIHAGLLGIARVVGELDKVRSTPDDIRRYGFGEKAEFETLIAEIDGEFAGMCLWFPYFSTWAGRPGAYVQDLYVADRFRSAGVGARLMQRLAAITRQRGGAHVRLAVDTQNFRAQAFYTRLGLARFDTDHIHAAYGEAFNALADGDERTGP